MIGAGGSCVGFHVDGTVSRPQVNRTGTWPTLVFLV
jgi:hypothetical protein